MGSEIQILDPQYGGSTEIDPEKLAKKRPVGRPCRLTPELQARLCAHIEDGLFHARAAALEGIDEVTFSRWMRRGAKADPSETDETLYRDFYIAVKHAEASCQQNLIETLRQVGAGNPKTLQWFLSRRFAAEYGRQDNVAALTDESKAEDAKALREALLERLEKLVPPEDPPPEAPPPSLEVGADQNG